MDIYRGRNKPRYKHGSLAVPAPLLSEAQKNLLGSVAASHALMETNLNSIVQAIVEVGPALPKYSNWRQKSFKDRCSIFRSLHQRNTYSKNFESDLNSFLDYAVQLHKVRSAILHGTFSVALLQGQSIQQVTSEYEKELRTFLFNDAQISELSTRILYHAGVIEMLWKGQSNPWFLDDDVQEIHSVYGEIIAGYYRVTEADIESQICYLL